jgi:hypothetical protein
LFLEKVLVDFQEAFPEVVNCPCVEKSALACSGLALHVAPKAPERLLQICLRMQLRQAASDVQLENLF